MGVLPRTLWVAISMLRSILAILTITVFLVHAIAQERPSFKSELKPPESLPIASRVWTDASGKFEVAAHMVDAKDGYVQLQKADGSMLSIPVEKLSEKDQIFARQILVPRASPKAEVILAKVVKILDGDTLRVANALVSVKTVRLNGIDAPEKGQPFADEAVACLEKLVGQVVRVEFVEEDQYNRVLGDVYAEDGRWLNHEMVADGLAWHYQKVSTDQRLVDAEDNAKAHKLLIWSTEARIAPWDWRDGIREYVDVPTKPVEPPVKKLDERIVYITETGTHYHAAGCRHLAKSKIPIPLSRAVSAYDPCKQCKPPHE